MASLLKAAREYLRSRGVEGARLDAELLLCRVLGCERLELYLRHTMPVTPKDRGAFRQLIRRRGAGEPAAYILGEKEFYGLLFKVTRSCLIPRPETEHLVDAALGHLRREDGPPTPRVVDLGTGSGCILAALATHFPEGRWIGVDLSREALSVAEENLERLLGGSSFELRHGSWFEPILDLSPFDLVLANPPYISREQIQALAPTDALLWEPSVALSPGEDALAPHRHIIKQGWPLLSPGGAIFLELPDGGDRLLAAWVQKQELGEASLTLERDLSGIPRVLSLVKGGGPPLS